MSQTKPLSEVFQLPKNLDGRGDLTFIEYPQHIPFPIARVYYLYNVPGVMARGFHAHRELKQLMIALNGSFEVLLDNGHHRETVSLCQPDQGLYIGPMIWHEMKNFSPGSICLVLASQHFDESDYIRSYADFLQQLRK
ncbi:MAG TPA: FdtA/QdtA family cupin domain-containing protein [Pirellulaceae bacterium]|nr:FdtA/QdtA family cupin domain-containing protein [Pirellulaceae bacterium]HMO93447.1 FdtA/QdtA family cupin domain-containing protein [Pirellulaceae bacterium]HMP68445.1 FdtA/QdtA family cupin domain-containing protein [Pirellulaceae bacterium]